MEKQNEQQVVKQKNDYPLVLNAKHIQEILGVGRRVAYELMDRNDFPLVKIGEKLKRVNRDDFFSWLESQSNKKIS
jgi:predicted DNA-binding transcriptional regulator AlpA